jgi:hypothetical protein
VSDGRSLAERLVSQLGTPRDHMAELLGAGMALLLLLAYVGLEYGLGRVLLRFARTIKSSFAGRSDPP